MHDSTVSSPGISGEAPPDEARAAGVSAETRSVPREGVPGSGRWLVLTHHLPAEPAYFRVKVRRRLERLGAVPLKRSVYVLPADDETLEDFQWLLQEILGEGGEATLSEARFLDGFTDDRLVSDFRSRRAADYEDVVRAAREIEDEIPGAPDPAVTGHDAAAAQVRALARRLEEVIAMDRFGAEGRARARKAVTELRDRVLGGPSGAPGPVAAAAGIGTGRTWVTRAGVKVDRMASAWLIRLAIDPEARFRFVTPDDSEPRPGEITFDMFDGEFTHVGELCTFETLLDAFRLDDPALAAIGEIVHDIDCKDEKFGRDETAGIASLIGGVVRRHPDDQARLERGAALFDELYEHFRSPRV